MAQVTRRTFLTAAAGTAGALAFSAGSRVLGANEALRVGVIGIRGRGKDLMAGIRKQKDMRIVALSDCDSEVLAKGVKDAEEKGEKVTPYADLRKLLESNEIDAVVTATPNHWHSLLTVWAVQSGKDVYVEKPVSHNVWEGAQMVAAARKYNRIVQTGTQSRSSPGLHAAVKFLREGGLGKIQLARGLCYKRRASIGKVSGEQPVPKNVDYDLWCGPSPKVPLLREKLHYDWHWVWPTGNGDIGNQGIHQVDIARWVLGQQELAPRILSIGGRLGYVDDGQTPNTQILYFDYAPAPLLFEVRGLPQGPGSNDMDEYRGAKVGVIVHCEHGTVSIPTYTYAVVHDKDGKEVRRFGQVEKEVDGKKKWVDAGGGDHMANFAAAVRERKFETLNADIREGHLSSALCHLGNISHALGQPGSPGSIKEAVRNTPHMAEAYERMAGHLAKNQVDLDKTPLTLGAALEFDPKCDRFVGNAAANDLLRREYRKGFEVPEKV